MAAAIVAIVGFGLLLPSELAPLEDRSRIRLISRAPEGATFEYMDAYVTSLAEAVKENVPERSGVLSVTAGGSEEEV